MINQNDPYSYYRKRETTRNLRYDDTQYTQIELPILFEKCVASINCAINLHDVIAIEAADGDIFKRSEPSETFMLFRVFFFIKKNI